MTLLRFVLALSLYPPAAAWSATLPASAASAAVVEPCSSASNIVAAPQETLTAAVAVASSRRLFFGKAASTVASGAAATALLTASPVRASAASSPSVYTPPPHSMDGKVVLITGGTTGLGLESGKRLAAAGASVILTARSKEKGEAALGAVRDYLSRQGAESNGDLFALPLDLCDFTSIRAFPRLLSDRLGEGRSVDVLMNNAGVMAVPDRRITADGFEKTFQTNHLGHFLLTAELLPKLLVRDARIINVSSEAWQIAGKGLELDNLNGEKSYGAWTSYGQSKLANILFTKELQSRADTAGRPLVVSSLHPGAVQTDLSRFVVGEEKWESIKVKGFSDAADKFFFESLARFIKTVEEGASTQVYLAAGEGGNSDKGQYFIDCEKVSLKGAPMDKQKGRELWALSEEMTGTRFDL